jgi:hypothetical protein
MTTWAGIIAVENVLSSDGRLLAAGAVQWDPDQSLPLTAETGDEANPIAVVGSVDLVWREGQYIRAYGHMLVPFEEGEDRYLPLAASCDQMEVGDETSRLVVVFTKARLRQVLLKQSAWSACHITEVND